MVKASLATALSARPVKASPGCSGATASILPNNESRLTLPYGVTSVSVTVSAPLVPGIAVGTLSYPLPRLKESYTDPTVGKAESASPLAGKTSLTVNSVLVKPARFVTLSPASMLPRSVPLRLYTSKYWGALLTPSIVPPPRVNSGGPLLNGPTAAKPSVSIPLGAKPDAAPGRPSMGGMVNGSKV